MKPLSLLFLLCLVLSNPLLAANGKADRDQIRQHVEQIRAGESLEIENSLVSSVLVLPALYEKRQFAPVWTREDSISQLIMSTVEAVVVALQGQWPRSLANPEVKEAANRRIK